MPVLAEDFRARHPGSGRRIPDMGFAKRARHFALLLDSPVAIGDKVRRRHEERAEVLSIVGDVRGCNALIVDDIIVSGTSLVSLAEVLVRGGREGGDLCRGNPRGAFRGRGGEAGRQPDQGSGDHRHAPSSTGEAPSQDPPGFGHPPSLPRRSGASTREESVSFLFQGSSPARPLGEPQESPSFAARPLAYASRPQARRRSATPRRAPCRPRSRRRRGWIGIRS